jgi:hypothetical protein
VFRFLVDILLIEVQMILSLLIGCATTDVTSEGYTDGQSYYVVYETNPSPIPFNEEFSVLVSVYDNDQKETPLNTVSVDVDANMPDHGHGMNQSPTVSGPSTDIYTAEGLLWHMEGEWELMIYISGESNENIAFTIPCCQ